MTESEATAVATGTALIDVALMLGAALLFVAIFRRLGLGATLGYIVAGVVIGPFALGLIDEPELVMQVSEIGIALLLFLIGLELHPSRLWRLRADIFGLGLIQVVACGLVLSALIHFALAVSIPASLAIGLPLRSVVDRAGSADAPLVGADAREARRARILDPVVPGPGAGADDHHHRRHVARPG